jgi:diguanylate cyclase (GGDEF)-like protein/PAS domain S-box-containing protein
MMNPTERAHVLIVDDDPLLRSMVTQTLLHAGFDVSEAESGEAGLARIGERRFDLILLDVMMSGLDGYEVCQRIRAMPEGAAVPILMLTGLNDTASIELAYGQGATDFITKPINWTLLSHKVRYALRASTAAEAMRRSRERLARAQSLASMGNWTLLPDGRMEISAELRRLFGMPAEEGQWISAETLLQLVVASDRGAVRRARARLLSEGLPYQVTFRIRRADGGVRTVFEQAAPLEGAGGHARRIEGITQDVTERVRAEERIQELAHYDAATGLPNGKFFAELAGPSLERAARRGRGCALMHVDIDRFKGVNDAFGRGEGDAVLKKVAERLRSWTRHGDLAAVDERPADRGTLASVGGNAFTLLITDIAGQEQASGVAQRLLKVIGQPITVEAQSLVLTASIGIAFYPNDAHDLAGLARCAEQALHAAKDAGRAQHRFFDGQMNARAANRLRLEADLRRAIAQEELRLHFQPKVDATSGAVVGAEALVRWQHPERGMIPPGEFIGLAEETGLILPLTDWVLECACRNLREWSDAGLPAIPLSVNLAASSLEGVTLVGKLDGLMQRFGLQPESLTLEITESILMRDVESSMALLQTLCDRGYGISLDDFGTGYSSLSYLKRLPLDELKVDRAFVTDAERGGRDGALAATIIALGRELGLHVVAEGVETREQSAFLLRRGCNVQQGYLFSRPVPADAFAQLLQAGFVESLDRSASGAA